MSEEANSMCLRCGYKWHSKWTPETIPDRTQCPRCWGYSVVLLEQYEEDLQYLKKLFTSEDTKKFLQLYDFAVEHGYIRNTKSREIRFQRLLQDLTKPESSLGEKGVGPK